MKKTLLAISSLCLCLCLTGCGAKTVNMDKAIHIECSGYNGYATASANIVDQEILDLLTSAGLSAAQAQEIRDSMMLRTNKTDSLANNDKVTVTLSFDAELTKKHGIELTGTTKELTVSGLENPEPFDIFENVEIRCYRWSNYAEIYIFPLTEDHIWNDVTFKILGQGKLMNGDTVTVHAEIIPEIAAIHGKIIDKFECTVAIEGIPTYSEYHDLNPEFSLLDGYPHKYSYVVLKPSEIQ